jgi:hypothetical protein
VWLGLSERTTDVFEPIKWGMCVKVISVSLSSSRTPPMKCVKSVGRPAATYSRSVMKTAYVTLPIANGD